MQIAQYYSQERSYSGVSLACLEIRSRNEEKINSTRNRIYSLKVFNFLLYRRSSILQDIYFLSVSELIATTGNTSAVAGCTRV